MILCIYRYFIKKEKKNQPSKRRTRTHNIWVRAHTVSFFFFLGEEAHMVSGHTHSAGNHIAPQRWREILNSILPQSPNLLR